MSTVLKFEAIGTTWQIDIEESFSKEKELQLLEKIKNRIDVFDKDYSRFRSDSLVTKMSQEVGVYDLPDDAKPMMDIYERLYKLTGGSLTPLIGRVMEDAGYDPQYSLETKGTLTQPPAWNEAIEYNFPKLSIKKPVMLDFGAAGKGYLIDIVSNLILSEDIKVFTIDAGGDITHQGSQDSSLTVGLENPSDISEVIGKAQISNNSICGSAGNRRAWGEFHHIIDPYTLKSPRHILATWVTADTALLGDAIATALFFTGPRELKNIFEFEYLILNSDNSVEKSDNFKAELYIKD